MSILDEMFVFKIGDKVRVSQSSMIILGNVGLQVESLNTNAFGTKAMLKDNKTGKKYGPISVVNLKRI